MTEGRDAFTLALGLVEHSVGTACRGNVADKLEISVASFVRCGGNAAAGRGHDGGCGEGEEMKERFHIGYAGCSIRSLLPIVLSDTHSLNCFNYCLVYAVVGRCWLLVVVACCGLRIDDS